MKDIKEIDLEQAKQSYITAVTGFKDQYANNWLKNHSWPWATTGIERSKMFIKEVTAAKSPADLMKVVADKKYHTGIELIGIIKKITLEQFGVTENDITAVKEQLPKTHLVTTRAGRGSVAAEIKYTPKELQANAKETVFNNIVEPHQQTEMSYFSCLTM